MFVTSCPNCGDAVTVPSRARPTSQLRCPLCICEFTLEELMSTLPPVLELVNESEDDAYYAEAPARHAALGGAEAGGVATMSAHGTGEDYASADDHGDIALAEAEPRAEKPSYSFDGSAAAPTKGGTRPSVAGGARPKKKGKNPLIEVVKVVFGGLAAIPIAIAILWFGFGQDPFEAGPAIAKYAPWAVPAKFHGKTPEPKPEAPATNASGNKPKKNKIEGLPKVDNQEIPSLELGPTLPTPAKDPNELDPGSGLGAPPGLEIDPIAPPDDLEMKKDAAAPATNDPLAIDPPAVSDPLAVEPPAAKAADAPAKLAVANAPAHTGPEIAEALGNANKALQAFEEGAAAADDAAKKVLSRNLYKSLAELAEKVTFADGDDLEVATQLQAGRELFSSLQGKPEVLALVTQVGSLWAMTSTADQRGTNGVVLVGTLAEKAGDDKGSAHTLVTESAKLPEASLVIASKQAKAGEKSLVLGVIVDEPTLAIPGFVGEENRVVFSDILIPLAAQ